MRRGALLSGLTLLVALALSGPENARAAGAEHEPVRGQKVTPVRTGVVDLEQALERQRLSGPAEGPRKGARRPPRRLPEMPMPEFWTPPPLPDEPALGAAYDAPLAPALSLNFPGQGDNSVAAIPPDTHGAVGPTKVMTTLNSQVLVQDRLGGTVSGPIALNFFWNSIATAGVFDPRVLYDPDPAYGGRWIWAAVQGSPAEFSGTRSGLLIAASTGNEPLRGPAAFFDADPADLVWADYPSVGFNKNWVVVQVNMFDIGGGQLFNHSKIYVFNKAQLYAGTFAPTVITLGATSCGGGPCGGTQVPAATYDFAQDDLYLLQRWNSGAGALRLYRLSTPALPAITPLGFPIGAAWADTEPTQSGADFAPQGPSCGGAKIQTNDSRIQNVVWRNGTLWATHTVFLPSPTPNRASVQWWQVQTNATVSQRGLVDEPGATRFYAFPSIAVNKNDDVLVGFSSFSASEPVSARYAFRLATDPANTLQVPSVLKPGEDCYDKDYSTGRTRWGDYSATVVDPTDDKRMWTLQEYAETAAGPLRDDSRWGTWWGLLDPTPVVSITDAFVTEGDSGTTPATFDLALSVATSQVVTIDWTTANGSATTGDNDYVGASGTVVFAPGETAKTVVVDVKGDLKKEPIETFFVNLTLQSAGAATMPDTQGAGTIANDDPDPQVSIGDRQVLEGSPSGTTPAAFLVTLSNPSSTTVTVNYNAAPGTATIGSVSPDDLNPAGGTLNFAPGVVELQVTVSILKDVTGEPDETFFVNLSSPVGATILKGTGNGVILNDDPASSEPGVAFLTAVSDGGVTTGRNRLQWLNPPAGAAPTGIRIKWNQGAGCGAPDPFDPDVVSFGTVTPDEAYLGPGVVQGYEHGGRPVGVEHCYTVWVQYGASYSLPGATVQATPFNSSTGRVRWKYFTGLGATTVAPPTVGTDGVLVPSNDNLVHGLTRGTGPSGGTWPAAWKPANLGSQAQARSPIVPFAGGSRAFYSTLDGWVHAVDAKTGAILWETQIGTAAQTGAGGAPAGIFTAFGGSWDYILVGTRQATNNRFYALDPATGAVLDSFPTAAELGVVGELGAVTGMAAVDYARGQVYFGTFGGATNALWCLKLGPPSDALQGGSGWVVPKAVLGNIDGSPVTRGDRVYVGTTAGLLWSIRATDGLDRYSHTPTGVPEPIKGFPFPDRGSNALYFSTTTRVHSAVDNGAADFNQKWNPQVGLTSPSPVLYWAAQDRLYVGMESWGGPAGAWLYDINAASGGANTIQLESGTPIAIGAPSLDTGVAPVLLHAGSVAGVIYAVQVP